MKNLILSLAFMLMGSFAFANATKEADIKPIQKNIVTFINNNIVSENENTVNGCASCPTDCCQITYTDSNGTIRNRQACCGSIVVVKLPPPIK